MTNAIDNAHDPDAMRAAICHFLISEGGDTIPACANALDAHDRRLFLKIRDALRFDIESQST